jgi:hypothetical protein
MFYPNIIYAIECYVCGSLSTIKKLQVTQNKALKSLFNYDRLYPSDALYKETCLMDITTLFQYRSALLIKDLITTDTDFLNIHNIIKSCYTSFDHKYSTRDKSKFNLSFNKVPHTLSLTFKHQLIWNKIPLHIRNLHSTSSFKTALLSANKPTVTLIQKKSISYVASCNK